MVGVNALNDPTLSNKYPNLEVEYIFACKGRPFGCLTSPHIPTPSSTLMDYNLVKDLGLKMYDLQYQKFSYCGQKLRILGRVSISVQTIHDGLASGSFHLKANVILDLNKSVDCECVAGVKLSSRLIQASSSKCSGDNSPSTSTTTSSRSSPSPTSSKQSSTPKSPSKATPSAFARTSATSPLARPSANPSGRTSPTSSFPPGFPPQPQYRFPDIYKRNRKPEICVPRHHSRSETNHT